MKRPIAYILPVAALLAAASCTKTPAVEKPDSGLAVRWNMTGVEAFVTKSLVTGREQMERSCTPADKDYTYSDGTKAAGLGQSVGIWADYGITIDGVHQEVEDVFAGTKLIYNPESAYSDSKWEYLSNPAYWTIGGEYVFRAYYPDNELNVNYKLSSAKSLVIEMNTAKTQRDMLLAHNSYDTNTGLDASGEKKGLSDPVELNFRHAMSAMRFRFKFYDGSDGVFYSDDALTSFWMETDKDDSFALTGYMIYGNGTDYTEGQIQWRYQYYPAADIRFYRWECPEGVPFSNVRNADGTFSPTRDQTVALAYSVKGSGESQGEEFTRHDGWIVVIPQASTGKLRLYFTTAAGGDAVFSVVIPKETGTSLEQYYADIAGLQEGIGATSGETPGKSDSGTDFVPGWRYTYTIAISKTDASLSLDIAPWKRLDSSFDIKFE